MSVLLGLQQVEPDPNLSWSNFIDYHKNESENSCTTAMLRVVHDSFGQIFLFLTFLNSLWVWSKKNLGKEKRWDKNNEESVQIHWWLSQSDCSLGSYEWQCRGYKGQWSGCLKTRGNFSASVQTCCVIPESHLGPHSQKYLKICLKSFKWHQIQC